MMSIPNFMAPLLAQVPAELLLVVLAAVALALIFAGSSIVKVVAFFVVGFAGASLGGLLWAQYVGASGDFVGVLLGFVVGGLLGVALIPIGIGLLVGYAAYLVSLDLALSATVALIAGVVFFIVGLALSQKILVGVTAVAGGFLLFDVLTTLGFGLALSMLVAAGLTLVGLWVQYSPERRVPPTQAVRT
jgi:hypothetical protein